MEAHIEALEGRWTGQGRGEYPTIEDFDYTETVTLDRLGQKPILAYTQRTAANDGRPLHTEAGYYRFSRDGVELVIAQATGIAECHRGRFDGGTLVLTQTSLIASSTAVQVDEVRRVLTVDGDTLSYQLEMAAVGLPLTFHLAATLHRS